MPFRLFYSLSPTRLLSLETPTYVCIDSIFYDHSAARRGCQPRRLDAGSGAG